MMLILSGVGFWSWQSRDFIVEQVGIVTAKAGLKLERIEIEGRLNVSHEAIAEALGVSWYAPMLTLDLRRIHADLSALGWVRSARLERKLPNTLIIILEERQALALFQDKSGHHVIDRDGSIIAGIEPESFTHLPVIKGRGATTHAESILKLLRNEPDLFAEVWSLSYQSERRWDVFLRNNIRVQLPETSPADAWARFARLNREHNLTARDLANIDLRVPDKLVIKPVRSNLKGSNT